jgi:hypothetical protein
MNRTAAFLVAAAGLGLGGAAMYFGDPKRGRNRRAVARDKAAAAWRDTAGTVGKR